ncbi:hypothetical protein CYMTET_51266 [Cymbomonas tetramitiformis]|uniref:MYND-type domain-containing protein n=1 Tax=Cymbomonas tetramitiformis TaxID=36881 RepID=A0AAE0BNE8_9CHLO|nr:hypothetical protein CYMTET_51266 [Cymbomonas tetramitiformis]
MDVCAVCEVQDSTKLLRCSACKRTYYCCAEHQRIDWPRHRSICCVVQPDIPAKPQRAETEAGTDQADRNVLILAPGSRGDVEPLIAIAKQLKSLGHNVTVATHVNYEADVCSRGVKFHPVHGDPHQNRGGAPIEGDEAAHIWTSQLASYRAAAEAARADIIAFNWFGSAGMHLAEALRVPCVALWMVPFSRTNRFPSFFFTGPKMERARGGLEAKHGAKWRAMSHVLVEEMMWAPFGKRINEWRRELGLEPIDCQGGCGGHYLEMRRRDVPIMYGWSPEVLPKPDDWPKSTMVCGAFVDEDVGGGGPGWEPPCELAAFLESGPAPIYMGFGSARLPSSVENPARRLVQAARALGQRVLLAGGEGQALCRPGGMEPDDHVMEVGLVPHGWLLPRVSVAVHHGGAGTTASSLLAGAPQVICPIEYDQFFWAETMCSLGVAPCMLPAEQLALSRAKEALEWAIQPEVRDRAWKIRDKMKLESGALTAATFISMYQEKWVDRTISCRN